MKKLLILLAIICQIATGANCFEKTPIMLALDQTQEPTCIAVAKALEKGVPLHYARKLSGRIFCLELEYVEGKIQRYSYCVTMHDQEAGPDPEYIINFKEVRARLQNEELSQVQKILQHERYSMIRSCWISAVLRARPAPTKPSCSSTHL